MNMETIKNNDSVKVHYTGTLEDGTIFDSSKQDGREPLEAKLGYGMLIKGFEDALIGMSVGETKSISIDPEFAYGNHNPAQGIQLNWHILGHHQRNLVVVS